MSFLSSIAPALGGIGQGVTQGLNALNQQEQQKFQKEQQDFQRTQNARLLAQQAEEENVANQIRGIKRTSTPDQWGAGYEGAQARNEPLRDDNGQLMPGVKAGIARPQHEIMADMASTYLASPDLKMQQYGQSLLKQAQEEKEYSSLQDVQNKYKKARELLQSDPEAFAKLYVPQFNNNQLGGNAVQGITANILNTPNGRTVSVVGPNNEVMHQIPLTREYLGHALRSLQMEELADNPRYAGLAMENEKLGLQREANETDAQYKNRMASVYENRNVIDEKEMKGKLALWGAQAKKASTEMEGFSQFLGQDDNGKIHGILKNGKLGTIDAPLNKDGTPIQLMDKFTGAKGIKKTVKIEKDSEGNLVAFDTEGRVVHNIISGGLEVPPGVTESKYKQLNLQASKLGVPLHLGKDKDGSPTIAYLGKDGQYYSTPEEAVKAKVTSALVPK